MFGILNESYLLVDKRDRYCEDNELRILLANFDIRREPWCRYLEEYGAEGVIHLGGVAFDWLTGDGLVYGKWLADIKGKPRKGSES